MTPTIGPRIPAVSQVGVVPGGGVVNPVRVSKGKDDLGWLVRLGGRVDGGHGLGVTGRVDAVARAVQARLDAYTSQRDAGVGQGAATGGSDGCAVAFAWGRR